MKFLKTLCLALLFIFSAVAAHAQEYQSHYYFYAGGNGDILAQDRCGSEVFSLVAVSNGYSAGVNYNGIETFDFDFIVIADDELTRSYRVSYSFSVESLREPMTFTGSFILTPANEVEVDNVLFQGAYIDGCIPIEDLPRNVSLQSLHLTNHDVK